MHELHFITSWNNINSFIAEVIGSMFNKANLLKFVCGWFETCVIDVMSNVGVALVCIKQSFIRASFKYYHRLTH